LDRREVPLGAGAIDVHCVHGRTRVVRELSGPAHCLRLPCDPSTPTTMTLFIASSSDVFVRASSVRRHVDGR